jgi:hypothetical protein
MIIYQVTESKAFAEAFSTKKDLEVKKIKCTKK